MSYAKLGLVSALVYFIVSCNNKHLKNRVYTDKRYYENGKLKSEIQYHDTIKNGIAKEYYENGSLKKSYSYKNDTLDGEFQSFTRSGMIESKGHFWKGKAVGPMYYYNNGKLVLYNERDFNEIVYYVKKYDENGNLIKEEGLAISPNFVISANSDTISKNTLVSFACFYSEPDGYRNHIEAYVNDSVQNLINVGKHVIEVNTMLNQDGENIVKFISTLSNKDKLVRKDSSYIRFFVTED